MKDVPFFSFFTFIKRIPVNEDEESDDNEEDDGNDAEDEEGNDIDDRDDRNAEGEEDEVGNDGRHLAENQLQDLMLAPLDQGKNPKVGDIISYGIEVNTEHERWAEARITSKSPTPHYYNIRRLDTNEMLGIYLLPNTAWHFGYRLECERAPMLHPDSRETSPLLLRREEREFHYSFDLDYMGEPLKLADSSAPTSC